MQNKLKTVNTEIDMESIRIFNCSSDVDKAEFSSLISQKNPQLVNSIDSQLVDLVTCLNPGRTMAGVDPQDLIKEYLANNGPYPEIWVYYPWKNQAARILKKSDFIFCRTNRNKLKISSQEQDIFNTKRILFIGLSVGQSAALTFAMQRLGGNYILADFDELSLTNLNRLRASVLEIGKLKTEIAYRQITEQDPYFNINLLNEGLTVENIESVISGELFGKPDLIVEECDSIDIKILSREMARKYGIPVIMETSDKGMLDVERFDLEKERPLFHGLAGDINFEGFKQLSPEQRFGILTKIVDYEKTSGKLKESYAAVGKELLTWPQLGYEVTLGGATLAYVAGKILSGQIMNSGRIYVDLDSIFQTIIDPGS